MNAKKIGCYFGVLAVGVAGVIGIDLINKSSNTQPSIETPNIVPDFIVDNNNVEQKGTDVILGRVHYRTMMNNSSVDVVLSEDIALNVYVDVALAGETPKAIFTVDNVTYEIRGRLENGEYVFTFRGVSVKQLTTEISYVIKSEVDDLENNSLTLKQYLMDLFARDDTTVETKRLIVDLLNYGAEAQLYANYKTNDLANNNIEGADMASGYEDTNKEITFAGDANGVTWLKSRAWFSSRIGVGLAFSADKSINKTELEAKFVFNGEEYIVPGSQFRNVTNELSIEGNQAAYEVVFNNVAATQYNEDITAVVMMADQELSSTATFSVGAYLNVAANQSSEHAELYKAAFKYGKSATNVLYANEIANVESKVVKEATCQEEGIKAKEFNGYLYEKEEVAKVDHSYLYEYNPADKQYHRTCKYDGDNQDWVEQELFKNKSVKINGEAYDAYSCYEKTTNLIYNANSDAFVLTIDEAISGKDLTIDAADGEVIIDVPTDAHIGKLTFNNGFRKLFIQGKGILTINGNVKTQAAETHITSKVNVEMHDNSARAIEVDNGGAKFIVSESGDLTIGTTAEKDGNVFGIISPNTIINGKLSINNFSRGIHMNGDVWINESANVSINGCDWGIYSFSGSVQVNGNLSITNCNMGINLSTETWSNSGWVTVKGNLNMSDVKVGISSVGKNLTFESGVSSIAATQTVFQLGEANLDMFGGTLTIENKSNVDTLNCKNLNVGKKLENGTYTDPILNVISNGGGGISNSGLGTANYNFVSGTTTITQNGSGNCGFSFNADKDKVVVEKDAKLSVNNYQIGFAEWSSNAAIVIRGGEASVTNSSETGVNKINTLSIIEGGLFKINSTGDGITSVPNITIDGGTLEIDAKSCGINNATNNSVLTVRDGGLLKIVSTGDGIKSIPNITIDGGALEIDANSCGINNATNILIASNGSLKIETNGWGITNSDGQANYQFLDGVALIAKKDGNGFAAINFEKSFKQFQIGENFNMGIYNFAYGIRDASASSKFTNVADENGLVSYIQGYVYLSNTGSNTYGVWENDSPNYWTNISKLNDCESINAFYELFNQKIAKGE